MAIWQVLPVPGSLCMCMHKYKTALLVQPSSAERVFSLLNNSFKENQARVLEDYIETSIMLPYNRV